MVAMWHNHRYHRQSLYHQYRPSPSSVTSALVEFQVPRKSSKLVRGVLSLSNACSTCGSMKELMQLHAQAIKLRLAEDRSVVSQILSFCAISDAGSLHYATLLFYTLHQHLLDSFLWNIMIRAHAKSDAPQSALHLFDEMLSQGSVPPDKFTFPFLLKACARLQALHEGEQLHSHVFKSGLASDPIVRNALINVYAQIGMLESARRVFDRNPQRDSVSWNSLIGGYLKHGHLEEAGRLFSQMPHQKTLFSWNIMVSGYAKSGRPELAKSLLRQLPSEFSNTNSPISLTCLISLYVEAGEVEAARRVFDSMGEKDIVCWSCMISGYVRSGNYMEALRLFKEMQQAGRKDHATKKSY